MAPSADVLLTPKQAYLVMFEFLRQHHERGPTDEIGGLLGSLSLLADGESADPAMLHDFEAALAAVVAAETQGGGYRAADFKLVSRGDA